jgi:ketosteroid isomerase-like protein
MLSMIGMMIFSCSNEPDQTIIQKWKDEIVSTEKDFAEMAAEKGLHEAFVAFAAEDAVLMRNNEVVVGKNNIDAFYEGRNTTGLNWKPDFVDVSSSGDLGYTYGQYTFTYSDSLGNSNESKGIFHTVWKRQNDGTWKFVWD